MIKFLFVGRRASGRTRAATLAHLRDIHGRMVVCPPADAGAMPDYYAQNHVIDGAYPAGNGAHALERDLVTELQFDSMEAMRAAVETPYYLENLRPDEPRFVDDATVARVNVVPRHVAAGKRTRYKLFVLVSRAAGTDDAAWNATCGTFDDKFGVWAGVTMMVANDVLPPPVGARFADTVFELWFEDRDAALAAAPQATAAFDAGEIDSARSIAIVAEEFTQEDLRARFGC